MEYFSNPNAELLHGEEFIQYVCSKFSVSKEDFRNKFAEECLNGGSNSAIYIAVKDIFSYNCFSADRLRVKKAKMTFLTYFFEYLISGSEGIEVLGRKLKEYDYSARCSLVWTNNYFAYRCKTCAKSPSMSLCSSCFTAGNHHGHDFNKFKSSAGGACDCGDASVIHESGYCRYHGPDKVENRAQPPEMLVAPLRCLLPRFLSALLYWLWELSVSSDPTTMTDEVVPALFVLHILHACGWVTQKMIVDVLIDPTIFERLKLESSSTAAYRDYMLSVSTNPGFLLPKIIQNQDLVHRTLLDAFIFCTIKLRFPENLVTFLIGLLAVPEFKEEFIHSYLNHYTRIASTVMISARSRMVTDWSVQMNNRIVHISVQLFSGEHLALRMVRERHLHYLLVHCLLNMCVGCRTRLDDRSNMVINCDGPLIQNNVFWPFVSDLCNLVSHKSVIDVFVEDKEFMQAFTEVLRCMQFMNCFVLKEGNHIEYETMAFYHAFTMEVEMSANPMWSIWKYFRRPEEASRCLLYVAACLSSLADLLTGLGRLVSPTVQAAHPIRSPFSLHLPLMRHVSCFLSLAVTGHGSDLRELLSSYLFPKPYLLRRFMDELANTLLGCHEVLIGYWVRNGQVLRQSIAHYMQSQFCYSFIDLDIFAIQACASLLPPAYLLNSLLNQTRLLRGICFHDELLGLTTALTPRNLDRKPMALEAWLTNLCWILDIRNNICLTPDELLKKELVCVLTPESRKRSDLANLIPERTGVSGPPANLDTILKNVATYSSPSCNEASGSLISGHYFLRPGVWHTDFDPVFNSLRVSSRRDATVVMGKYREHCRQRHGVANPSMLWPPYRTPKALPSNFAGLDHVLHSRHLHYLLFTQLSLFVYGDPMVTEESLGLVIHLLYRSLDTPCRADCRRQKCCIYVTNAFEGRPEKTCRSFAGRADDELMEFTDCNTDDDEADPKSDSLNCYEAASRMMELADEVDSDAEISQHPFDQPSIRTPRTVESGRPGTSGPSDGPHEHNGKHWARPSRSNSSEGNRDAVSSPLTMRQPHWDASLLACPYQPRTSILDNIACWLMASQSPTPRVELAPTLLATETRVPTNSLPSVSTIPHLQNVEDYSGHPNVLIDNILSLLIKAHARLYWNRLSGCAESVPSVPTVSGSGFVDANRAMPGVLASGPYTVANTESSTALANQHNTTGDYNQPKTKPSPDQPLLRPRCTGVLWPPSPQDCSLHQTGMSNSTSGVEMVQCSGGVAATGGGLADMGCSPIATGGKPNVSVRDVMKLSPDLRFFAAGPPAYVMPRERKTDGGEYPPTTTTPDLLASCCDPTDSQTQSDSPSEHCTAFGDGAYWIGRLLDRVCSLSKGCESAVRLYLVRARQVFSPPVRTLRLQPMDSCSSISSVVSARDVAEEEASVSPAPPTVDFVNAVPNPHELSSVKVDSGTAIDGRVSVSQCPTSMSPPTVNSMATARDERKRVASERRKRLMEQMASKQKAVASSYLKDLELNNNPSEEAPSLVNTSEATYDCVICQTAGKASNGDMVLLDMMCESGTMLHFRETPAFVQLNTRTLSQSCGAPADEYHDQVPQWLVPSRPPGFHADGLVSPHLVACDKTSGGSMQAPTGTVGISVLAAGISSSPSSISATSPEIYPPSGAGFNSPSVMLSRSGSGLGTKPLGSVPPPCHLESRRWWGLALPLAINKQLPLLRPGLLLQTCGHVVHRECFQRYRSQSSSRTGPPRNRNWVSCPLCRREVHHLLPLVPPPPPTTTTSDEGGPGDDRSKSLTSSRPQQHIQWLEKALSCLPSTGVTIWDDLNGVDDEAGAQRRNIMPQLVGDKFEATVLLRSQLECELCVLMSCPTFYSAVSRRCYWRELLCYLRRVYRSSADLQILLDSLMKPKNQLSPSAAQLNAPFLHVYALLQDPGDVLLSFMPHIWHREDVFLTMVAGTFCLAYVRALISAALNWPRRTDTSSSAVNYDRVIETTQALLSTLTAPIADHLRHLLSLLRESQLFASDSTTSDNHRLLATAASLPELDDGVSGDLGNESFGETELELHLVLRCLPLLRLAGLCLAKCHSVADGAAASVDAKPLLTSGLPFVGQLVCSASRWPSADTGYPTVSSEQRLSEFRELCRLLSLDCANTSVTGIVAQVAELAASRCGILDSSSSEAEPSHLKQLMSRWVGQLANREQSDASPASDLCPSPHSAANPIVPSSVLASGLEDHRRVWTSRLMALVEIGRQLYPPRLLRTPHSFDTLFNALHVITCDTVQHRFQENALCLICGRLLCTLCSSLPTAAVEHAYACEGFSGVVLEMNTSIVYVSLGATICDWGSIYLDEYGEEDLELRRGKPLFLDGERFQLLENQWQSHSFRHSLKHWRVV